MINWHLETISLSKLKPHPKNPRQINKDQFQHLTNLIEKFGLIDKPIINLDLVIIGGHQRIKALKKMAIKEVECWMPDHQLTEEEINHLMIGLNKNQGEFDFELLANNFEVMDLLNWGFTEKELLDLSKEEADAMDDSQVEEPNKSKSHVCPKCGHEFS